MSKQENRNAGKGDKPRHNLNEHWRREYDRIFKKKNVDKNKNKD